MQSLPAYANQAASQKYPENSAVAQKESQRISDRYVKALYDLAVSANALETVERDLAQLAASASQSKALQSFLANPLLSRTQKAAAMKDLLSRMGAHDLTQRFVAALAGNMRLSMLVDMIDRFETLIARARGVVRAKVTAAVALSAAQADNIAAALAKASGRKVTVETRANPAILGGLVVDFDGVMIDGSLSGKLWRLEKTLKSAASAA